MSNTRSLFHPRDAWEGWRETIGNMYLAENRTCTDIRAYLISNDFACSERQIKNRLREWKLECKKTPSQQYLAMLSIANNERNDGYEIMFDVPKRLGREYFNLKKIKKECDRVQKKLERGQEDFSLPSSETARLVLFAAGITAFWKFPDSGDPARPLNDSEISDEPGDCKRYSCGNPLASYTGRTAPIDDNVIVSQGEFERRSAYVSLENHSTCHSSPMAAQTAAMQVHNLCTTLNSHDLAPSSPMSVVVKNLPDSSWPLCEDEGLNWEPSYVDGQTRFLTYTELSPALHDITPTVTPYSDRTRFVIALLDTRSGFSSLQGYALKEEPMSNFEVPRNQIDMEEGNHRDLNANQGPKPVEHGFLRHRIDIGPMVISHNSQNPRDSVNEIGPDDEEVRVIYGLLDGVGDWVLPTLLWTQLILASNDRESELADFLSDSCATLEQAHRLESKDAFAVPFRYVWADLNRNYYGIIYWGQKLPLAQARIIKIQGFYHPNSLIMEHYTAWWDMACGRLQQGVTTLKASLAICEAHLGLGSIVTITRWVLISRGLEQQNKLDEALVYVTKATEQLNCRRSDLAKYRFMILHRRGAIELEVNRLDEAERHLLAALYGRFEVCGLDNSSTWSSITQLNNTLVRAGRVDRAGEMTDYFTKRFYWERHVEWACANQKAIDHELPEPPSWLSTEFQSKAAKFASQQLSQYWAAMKNESRYGSRRNDDEHDKMTP